MVAVVMIYPPDKPPPNLTEVALPFRNHGFEVRAHKNFAAGAKNDRRLPPGIRRGGRSNADSWRIPVFLQPHNCDRIRRIRQESEEYTSMPLGYCYV